MNLLFLTLLFPLIGWFILAFSRGRLSEGAAAIVGVGSTRRLSAVRWGVAGRIVWAWILTIPAAALIAAVSFYILAAMGMP